ncbi:MAG TPA: lytic transglycosylase domain-containing protein, partial [Blastocatellia bacterium]|nr:lytic transglycosylase domain-containing protein [Blastocatellia bacterium]
QELPRQKEGEQGFYWVATSLQKAARYGEAARRYSDFLNAYPDSEYTGRAYLNIVDCHRYAGEDGEAIQFAEQIERQFAGKPLNAVGLFDQARVQLSDGNYGRALDLLAKLEAHPVSPKQMGAPIPGEVEFLRAVTIEQMGRLGEAANLYLVIPDVRDNYFGHQATLRLQAMAATEKGRKVIGPLQIQYHAQARRALASGQYVEAKDAANRALRLSLDKAESQDLLDMLKACYSHLSQYSSVFQYRLAPAGRAVLEAGGTGEKSPTHEALASELIFLGLYDEGARELRQAGSIGGLAREAQPGERWHRKAAVKSEGGGEPAYSMAVYSNRGDQAHYAVAFGEPLFKSMPADYNLALLPRDLVELVYPAPYRAPLTRAARALGVDPRLILSLARQESRFDPEAKSPASARGLLQFIPETALKLAREEGLSKFQLDDVYDPKVALALTARYLSDLSKLFPDNPYAMAASYDAGEDSVQRWISRSRSTDVDRFVAEIAIPETADYVAKVMSNYRAYLELYTIDLKPKN